MNKTDFRINKVLEWADQLPVTTQESGLIRSSIKEICYILQDYKDMLDMKKNKGMWGGD